MNRTTLGHMLAMMAHAEEYVGLNHAATGGWDQWLIARGKEARLDYTKLVAGTLDFTAARRRWSKTNSFVWANIGAIQQAKSYDFARFVGCCVEDVVNALMSEEDDSPFCPRCSACGTDIVMDDFELHLCPSLPADDDDDSPAYRKLPLIYNAPEERP